MNIIIGILIGVIITTCVVVKAIYDVLKELKDEDKKKKTYNI